MSFISQYKEFFTGEKFSSFPQMSVESDFVYNSLNEFIESIASNTLMTKCSLISMGKIPGAQILTHVHGMNFHEDLMLYLHNNSENMYDNKFEEILTNAQSVILFCVLEEFYNPLRFLRCIKKHISHDKYFYLVCNNFFNIDKFIEQPDYNIKTIYTPFTLARLLGEAQIMPYRLFYIRANTNTLSLNASLYCKRSHVATCPYFGFSFKHAPCESST